MLEYYNLLLTEHMNILPTTTITTATTTHIYN